MRLAIGNASSVGGVQADTIAAGVTIVTSSPLALHSSAKTPPM